MSIPKSYRLEIKGLVRDLRVVEVVPGVHIGILKLATDAELTEAVGKALAAKLPRDVEVLVMPDGKAQSLLHVIERETRLPSVLARKSRKSYMREPVLDTLATSITTQERHAFYLDADDVDRIRGRKVAIIDDVVSSGGTIKAMQGLLELAGAASTVVLAVGTEGDRRDDVIALHHFPVYTG